MENVTFRRWMALHMEFVRRLHPLIYNIYSFTRIILMGYANVCILCDRLEYSTTLFKSTHNNTGARFNRSLTQESHNVYCSIVLHSSKQDYSQHSLHHTQNRQV